MCCQTALRRVPVCTGTTGRMRRTLGMRRGCIHGKGSSFPRRHGIARRDGPGDGSPSPRERRWAAAHPTSSFPRRRERGDGFPSPRERRWAPISSSRGGGNPRRGAGGWVPVIPRGRVGGGAPHNPFGGGPAGMGPRLHGNRRRWAGGRRTHNRQRGRSMGGGGRTTQSSLPATAGGGGDGFPSSTGTTNPWRGAAGMGPTSPRGRRRGSRHHGNDGGRTTGGRSSCPWRGSGGTLCCRPTS